MTRRIKSGSPGYSSSAALQATKRQATELLHQAAVKTLVRAATQGLKAVSDEMQDNLVEIGEMYAQDDADARQRLWQELGEVAQEAMGLAFDEKVTGREGPASATHYRAGDGRLAGGLVRRVLGDPDFFRATSLGLEWGNKELLDNAAAQWHRLNFGAGGRAGDDGGEEFPVRFGGGSGGTLTFGDEPSPGFSMPAGVWIGLDGKRVGAGSSANGADQFFPQRRPVRNDAGEKIGSINVRPKGVLGAANRSLQTSGIEGKHFMEAGLQSMADLLPLAFDEYAKDRFKRLSRVKKRRSASAIIAFQSPGALLEIELP